MTLSLKTFITGDIVECIKKVHHHIYPIFEGERFLVRGVTGTGNLSLHGRGEEDPDLYFNKDYFTKYVSKDVRFRKGDKIICLNNHGQRPEDRLTVGATYVVENAPNQYHVHVHGGTDGYAMWRFRLVQDARDMSTQAILAKIVEQKKAGQYANKNIHPFNIGDTVRCIDAQKASQLTRDMCYIVTNVNVHGIMLDGIMEAYGYWSSDRFERASARYANPCAEIMLDVHDEVLVYVPDITKPLPVAGSPPKVYKHKPMPEAALVRWPQDQMSAAVSLNEWRRVHSVRTD